MRGLGAIWGNHPLGHVVQCGVFKISRRLGYEGRALPVMKVFNGVTAAAAVAALFLVMITVLGMGALRSAGWTVVFGGTYGVWHFAGTADIYGLSLLLLIVAWGLTVWSLDRPSRGWSLLAGLAFGAATLSHQFSGVILASGTIGLLWSFRGRGRRQLVAWLGIFSIGDADNRGRIRAAGELRDRLLVSSAPPAVARAPRPRSDLRPVLHPGRRVHRAPFCRDHGVAE